MGNDNASGTLKLAVGLGITAIVLIIVVVAFNFGRSAANNAISNLSKETTQIEESRYTMYDGTKITGAEVLNVISKYSQDDIYIAVNCTPQDLSAVKNITDLTQPASTDDADQYIWDAGHTSHRDAAKQASMLVTAQDITSPHYINPSRNFYGRVNRAANTGAIVGISFWMLN